MQTFFFRTEAITPFPLTRTEIQTFDPFSKGMKRGESKSPWRHAPYPDLIQAQERGRQTENPGFPGPILQTELTQS